MADDLGVTSVTACLREGDVEVPALWERDGRVTTTYLDGVPALRDGEGLAFTYTLSVNLDG